MSNLNGSVLLALMVTVLVLYALLKGPYRRNPSAARTLLTSGFVLLMLLPLALIALPLRLPVGMSAEQLALCQPFIAGLRAPIPSAVSLLLLLITLIRVFAVQYRIQATRSAVRQLPLCSHAHLERRLTRLMAQLSYAGVRPRLLAGERTACSSLWGPAIVLPRTLIEASLAEDEPVSGSGAYVDAALAHELVHLQRGDDQWLLLAELVRALLWWLPGLSALQRHLAKAIEASCDARACDLFSPRLEYLDGLVAAARLEQGCVLETPSSKNRAAAGLTPVPSPPLSAAFPAALEVETARWPSALQRLLRATRDDLLDRLTRFGARLETDGAFPETLARLGVLMLGLLAMAAIEPVHRKSSTTVAAASLLPALSLGSRTASTPQAPVVPRVTQTIVATSEPAATAFLRRQSHEQRSAVYPGAALLAQQQGSVLVEFLLTLDGTPLRPRVLTSDPVGVFERSALRAVANSAYDPGVRERSSPTAAAFPSDQQPLRVRQRFRYELSEP